MNERMKGRGREEREGRREDWEGKGRRGEDWKMIGMGWRRREESGMRRR